MTRCEVLVQRARELGNENERIYGFCGQATIGAVMDTAGGIDPAVYKASTSLAGGACYACSACGAYTGGILCISSYAGRERVAADGHVTSSVASCTTSLSKPMGRFPAMVCRGSMWGVLSIFGFRKRRTSSLHWAPMIPFAPASVEMRPHG